MAVKTFYILNNVATSPGFFADLQDGGSAPSAVGSTYGWTVGKTASAYWRGRIGAVARATVSQASSYLTSPTTPVIGTGTAATTAGDSFVTPNPLSGDFAAGNWTFNFGMRTAAATNAGRIRFQMYASVNRNGTSARKIGTPQDCSAVTMNSTSATFNSTLAYNPGAIRLNNEYLFVAVEWQGTSTGTANQCSAQFYVSAASIVTTDYAADPATGTGALTNPDGCVMVSAGLVAGPPVADAWSNVDKLAAVTLSNGDKTATLSSATFAAVRSTQKYTSGSGGRYYAEFALTNVASTNFTVGFQLASATRDTTSSAVRVNVGTGNVNHGGGPVLGNVGSASTTGDVICMVWDSGTGRVWFRKNGELWNNDAGADPVAGTNGIDYGALPDEPCALHAYLGNTTNQSVTVRTELAEFTQTIPLGISSWMGEPTVPSVADAWNANDKTSNLTLSNGDKTGLGVTGSQAVRSTRTYVSGTAGKYYAEMVAGSGIPSGLGLSPLTNGIATQTGTIKANFFVGLIYLNNTSTGISITSFSVGDVCCMAWDAGAELVWFRRNNGAWNGNAANNPATGVGGVAFTLTPATAHALWLDCSINTGRSGTIRTELAEFTQAVPAGFNSWMDETPVAGEATGTGVLNAGVADLDATGKMASFAIGALQANIADLDATGTAQDVGGALWTPAELPTAQVGWWDASNAASIAWSGPNLTYWTNLSDAANPITPVGTGPTLTTVNGLGSLAFNLQPLKTTNPVSLGDFTIFAVYKSGPAGATGYERLVDHDYITGFWLGRDGAQTDRWGCGIKQTTAPYGLFVTLPDGPVHQIMSQRTGTAQITRGNGGAVSNSQSGDGTPTQSKVFGIAGGWDNVSLTDRLDNDVISEILIWNTSLSVADRDKVEGYLAHKWGIAASLPVGHPYKAAAPTTGAPAEVTGTGVLAAVGAALVATGQTASSGTAALTQPNASLSGAGVSISGGTAILTGGISAMASAGLVRATGTSVLIAGTATSVGAGLVAAVGTGTPAAGIAAMAGAGVSSSVGTASAQASLATLSAFEGAQVYTGTGTPAAQSATIAATGTAALPIITGSGTLGLVEVGEGPTPALDLTVAGVAESRVSPINMVLNNSPLPYVVSASNELVGYEAFRAFDGDFARTAHSEHPLATHAYWIKIDLGSSRYVAGYKYQARDIVYHCWKTWVLEGSNDDSTWTLVDTVVNESVFVASEIRAYVCDTPAVFRYWRWTVTATGGISGTSAEAASLELWSGTSAFAASLATTRTTGAYEQNTAGVLTWRAANTLRVSDLGVLREDAATNFIDYSTDFTQGWWTKENATITPNAVAAPDGTLTASTLTDNATDYFHRVYVWASAVETEGGATSFSVYVKPGTHNGWIRLYAVGAQAANFDTRNGVVGKVGSGMYAYIERLADGWCRCILVGPSGAGAHQPQIVMAPGDVDLGVWPTYPGTGQTIHIWGAQSETGNRSYTFHATSYIPTNGANGTRAEDVIRLTGAAKQIPNSGLGTLVVDFKTHHSDFNYAHIISQGGGFWLWTGASSDDTVHFAWTTATNANIHMLNGAKAAAVWNIAGRYRYAAYGGEFGQTLDVDVAATTDPWLGGGSMSGYFRRLTLWDRALAEQDLRNLTVPGVATGPQLMSVVSGDGLAKWVSSGPGVINADAATIAGSGTVAWIATGALVTTASLAGVAVGGSTAAVALTATPAVLSGQQGSMLQPSASTLVSYGLTQWVYSGPAVLSGTVSTIVASGVVRALGTGTAPSQVATVTATSLSRWVAAVALQPQAATIVSAGGSLSHGTGALTSASLIVSAGVSRSQGTGVVIADIADLDGYDQPAFLGGILVMGKATMTGTGVTSASGKGDLLPSMAA